MRSPTISALCLAFIWGCGGTPETRVDREGATAQSPTEAACTGDHCDVVPPPKIRGAKVTGDALELDFVPGVDAARALHYVGHCRTTPLVEAPDVEGFACPVELGGLKIDVSEGPAGLSLSIHVGDPQQSEALRQWFADKMR